ncbi:MAG: hypothetical protein Ct9H300mP12_10450 [Acidimicrobiales bacterium]|nr:MAG: hypothetical protein Ct9H300mP12_10450 [Acidimicrobiales bacterium]
MNITELDWLAAVAARDEAAQDALVDFTELDWLAPVAARDEAAQDALVDSRAGLGGRVAARDDALDDALKRSSALQTARKDLEVLEDEQQRLDYRLASARETLRVAQAARYVLGETTRSRSASMIRTCPTCQSWCCELTARQWPRVVRQLSRLRRPWNWSRISTSSTSLKEQPQRCRLQCARGRHHHAIGPGAGHAVHSGS